MRRILAVLLGIALTLAALIFLITRGGEVASIAQRGQSLVTLILALLQLVAIAFALAFVVFVLVQYARYVRPNRFVFEGFSNTSKLIEGVKMPLDLNILAREKLIYQFKVLDSEWVILSDEVSSDADALVTDGLFFGKTSQKQDHKKYVPEELTRNSEIIEDLKEVIKAVKDAEGINLMAFAEEIAPKEVTPVMKFVEAVIPPHIIQATGHLQWRSDEPGKAGITFEFVDLGSQRNLMVRTIWWKSLETNEAEPVAQSSTEVHVDAATKEIIAKQEQANGTDDSEISLATDRYIELLDPTMYWLALMFWKQKIVGNTSIFNYIRKGDEKKRQAQLLYFFGALYYACADRFKAYKDFFHQLAIEHFRQASTVDSQWCLPLLYLANLYSLKMQETKEEIDKKKLLEKAIELYKEALSRAQAQGDIYTSQRIKIAKALTELKDRDHFHAAKKEIETSEQEMDPADFNPSRSDCAAYLYNLAYWYALATQRIPFFVPHAKQSTRRYVAYCLARSEEFWVTIRNKKVFQEICEEAGLDALKDALDSKRREESRLATLKGGDFRKAINDVLREVSKTVNGWVVNEV